MTQTFFACLRDQSIKDAPATIDGVIKLIEEAVQELIKKPNAIAPLLHLSTAAGRLEALRNGLRGEV